jgi:hypothetical protein
MVDGRHEIMKEMHFRRSSQQAIALHLHYLFMFLGILLHRWRSYFPRELTNWEFLCELWWSIHDYTRAYMQMGMEQIRRLVTWDSESAAALSTARNRVRRRRIRRETSSIMPELEDVTVPDSEQTGGPPGGFPDNTSSFAVNGTSDTIRNRHAEPEVLRRNNVPIPQHRANDIEPAFLNDRDYPPGWIVYHRVLGVVPKTEADRYDRGHEAAAESNGTTGMNGNHDASLNANGHSTGGSDARQEEEQRQQILRSIAATG